MRPGIRRLYLALIVDGLQSAREATTPLPAAALSPAEVVTSMRPASQRRR